MAFKEIDYKTLSINPFTSFAKEWMLLTAGDESGYNTMTVSWGHLGAIWGSEGGKPTAVCYVRPQRYTKQFIDRADVFSLSLLPEEYKKALGYLGSHSGRDGDKVKAVGLTPVFGCGTTYFEEAKLVFVCKKMYCAPIKESGFICPEIIEENYPRRDYHDMYIGEVIKVLEK